MLQHDEAGPPVQGPAGRADEVASSHLPIAALAINQGSRSSSRFLAGERESCLHRGTDSTRMKPATDAANPPKLGPGAGRDLCLDDPHRSMKTLQATTAGLMGLVLAAALAFALLRHSSPALAWVALGATVLSLVWTGVRADIVDDQRRPFRIGFAVTGTLYLLLSLVVPLAMPAAPSLPTTRLLDGLEPILGTSHKAQAVLPRDRFDEALSEWSQAHPEADSPSISISVLNPTVATISWTNPRDPSFRLIGHSLLALLIATLAGLFCLVVTHFRFRSRPFAS